MASSERTDPEEGGNDTQTYNTDTLANTALIFLPLLPTGKANSARKPMHTNISAVTGPIESSSGWSLPQCDSARPDCNFDNWSF